MPRELLACCGVMLAVGLLVGASGCGEKKAPPNENVTKANADRIDVSRTTLSEVEQLLGPGTDCSDPRAVAGQRCKKWGPGKDGEEIRVVYQSDGQIVLREFMKLDAPK